MLVLKDKRDKFAALCNWYLGGTLDDWSMVFRRRVLLTIGGRYLGDVGPNFPDIKSLPSVLQSSLCIQVALLR